MAFQKSVLCLLLAFYMHAALSHAGPVRKQKGMSLPFFNHPSTVVNPMATALASKIHKNSILASAYNMPYAVPTYGVGLGAGLSSYNYAGGMGYNPYYQGYAPVYPGGYSNNHESYYSNHMGLPNGYSVNSQAAYLPNAFGYPTVGGRKTTYNKVKSHFGGSSSVSGVSYTGHDGLGQYNFGTHKEHVNLPGMTQVTYTHRHPVHPVYGTYAQFGNMGYY